MKSCRFLSICIILCHLLSCESENDFYGISYQEIQNVAEGFVDSETYVIIIPLTGCHPCVDASLNFVKNNTSKLGLKEDIKIIITSLSPDNKKNLSHLRGINISQAIISLDSLAVFDSIVFGSFNQAPVLLTMDESRLERVDVLKASNLEDTLSQILK